MTQYYPAQVSFRELRRVVPELGLLVDPRETQRLKDVERKKMLGKGPPKKGECRALSWIYRRKLQRGTRRFHGARWVGVHPTLPVCEVSKALMTLAVGVWPS